MMWHASDMILAWYNYIIDSLCSYDSCIPGVYIIWCQCYLLYFDTFHWWQRSPAMITMITMNYCLFSVIILCFRHLIPQTSNAYDGPVSPVTSQWSVLTSQSLYPNINHTCNVTSKYDNYYLLTPRNRVHELDLSLGGCCNHETSSNGNIFRVTGPLCGEYAGDR